MGKSKLAARTSLYCQQKDWRQQHWLYDEAEVFDRALSRREVQKIYDAGSAGKCPCVTPPSNMIAWWPGDGNANEIQGGNNGTLQNGVTFGPGEVGQAFHFNGSNQFVQVPDSPSWAFGSGDFTIDLWVTFSSLGSPDSFVGHNDGSGPQNKWVFERKNGQLNFYVNSPAIGNPGIDITSTPSFSPNTGEWHHVAVTKSGTAYTFYVDGNPGTPVSNSTTIPHANAPLVIGQNDEYT